MTTTMTIGDFSRATRLSAKALRLYHQAGLLEPAWIDPVNGYRVYSVEQIADAQVIRHFRSLDMPVELVRQVLAAPDRASRDQLIEEHLERMEAQLERTRSAVASLRTLLTPWHNDITVTHRRCDAVTALVIRETIDLSDLNSWYAEANRELDSVSAPTTIGPRGGIWPNDLFSDERGTAALFGPIASIADFPESVGRVRAEVLPAVDLAVATHTGSDDTIGQVYAALGDYVARNELGIDGPVREIYHGATTEIGFPIVSSDS